MLWIEAFHIIFVVAWFAGLFYLPRLFVYHVGAQDTISHQRFKVMEYKLFFYIMTPAGIVASLLGGWLIATNFDYYVHAGWLQAKLLLVIVLWLFHGYCGYVVKAFQQDKNIHTERFYRLFNEIPTLLLMAIVILVVVKP